MNLTNVPSFLPFTTTPSTRKLRKEKFETGYVDQFVFAIPTCMHMIKHHLMDEKLKHPSVTIQFFKIELLSQFLDRSFHIFQKNQNKMGYEPGIKI